MICPWKVLGSLLFLLPFAILEDIRRQVIPSPKGSIRGYESSYKNVFQYTLRYAEAPIGQLRWRDPVPISRWSGIYDATSPPPLCPQESTSSDSQSMSEDCLYFTAYSPYSGQGNKLPIMVWLHGGSFIEGGATNYGLDGSSLAGRTQMIVIVVQYRLGLLGFLRSSQANTNPPITGNYAVKDVILALNYIKELAESLGGDHNKITLAGQSSGADMIKTLLVTKSASGLFQRAILQSAPLNYGDHSIKTAEAIGSLAIPLLNCQDDCYRSSLGVDTILEVQNSLVQQIPGQEIPGVAATTPFRPIIDNELIKTDFMKAVNSPGNHDLDLQNRQLIFTTVKDEAAPTIASEAQQLKSIQEIPQFIDLALGSLEVNRSAAVQSSNVYRTPFWFEMPFTNPIEAAKDTLNLFGTDYIWRCPNQQVAVNLTRNFAPPGSNSGVWLAEFDLGIPYPSTRSISFCKGKVCHEDDILAVFGVPSDYFLFFPYLQKQLIEEVGARWAAFAATGSPNADGLVAWAPVAKSDDLNILQLGRMFGKISSDQRSQACSLNNGLWGIKGSMSRVSKTADLLLMACVLHLSSPIRFANHRRSLGVEVCSTFCLQTVMHFTFS